MSALGFLGQMGANSTKAAFVGERRETSPKGAYGMMVEAGEKLLITVSGSHWELIVL